MQNIGLPSLGGNWVDLSIFVIAILYLWEGWRRGFILGFIDLGGFLLSFVASLRLYSFVGYFLVSQFSLTKGIANALGFLIVGFVVEILLSLLVRISYQYLYPQKKVTRSSLLFINKLLGCIPAVGETVIFTAFLLTLTLVLPVSGVVKKDIVNSKIGGFLVSKTQGIERNLNLIFGEAVNETLTFVTINPNLSSNERVNLGFTQTQGKVDEAAEYTMLNLVNQERVSRGLPPVSLSFALRDLSRTYAQDMFLRGYFSHYNSEGESPFDRMTKASIAFLAAGENLALAPNVLIAHQGFMQSPGHRANILSSEFGTLGVGVIDGGIYGEMFVQEFTD